MYNNLDHRWCEEIIELGSPPHCEFVVSYKTDDCCYSVKVLSSRTSTYPEDVAGLIAYDSSRFGDGYFKTEGPFCTKTYFWTQAGHLYLLVTCLGDSYDCFWYSSGQKTKSLMNCSLEHLGVLGVELEV